MNLSPEEGDHTETDAMLRMAVQCALESTDFKLALDSYRARLPEVAPSLIAAMPPDGDARRALAFALFR